MSVSQIPSNQRIAQRLEVQRRGITSTRAAHGQSSSRRRPCRHLRSGGFNRSAIGRRRAGSERLRRGFASDVVVSTVQTLLLVCTCAPAGTTPMMVKRCPVHLQLAADNGWIGAEAACARGFGQHHRVCVRTVVRGQERSAEDRLHTQHVKESGCPLSERESVRRCHRCL